MLPRSGGSCEQDARASGALERAEGRRRGRFPLLLLLVFFCCCCCCCCSFVSLRLRFFFFVVVVFFSFGSFSVEPRSELRAEGSGREVRRRARRARGGGGDQGFLSGSDCGSRPLALSDVFAAAIAVIAAAPAPVLEVVLGEVLEPPAGGEEIVGAVI